MSLQREKSEPAESVDRRPGCFSSWESISGAEWSSLWCAGDVRTRRGMGMEDRGVEEGMMPVRG